MKDINFVNSIIQFLQSIAKHLILFKKKTVKLEWVKISYHEFMCWI